MTLATISPRRLRAREVSRFEVVVQSQTPQLWPIAWALTGEREAAAQAVKQCFAALEPRFAGMRSVDLADWLRRRVILTSLALVRERAEGAEPEIDVLLPRFDAEGRHEPRPTAVPRPYRAASEARKRSYREGLERLPHANRDVLLLCDVLGLGPDRAAELLGLRPPLLRYRLHQARLALREQIESER